LLSGHPCFFDGAKLTRLSPPESPVLALQRVSADGQETVLVLVNTDVDKSNALSLERDCPPRPADFPSAPAVDLFGQPTPKTKPTSDGRLTLTLGPGACHCLAPAHRRRRLEAEPKPTTVPAPAQVAGYGPGDAYRQARARAAW